MKNVRKKRFIIFRPKEPAENEKKWIRHEVRAKAIKDHPELFDIDEQVSKVHKKIRALEDKIISKPHRDAQHRMENLDILPMEEQTPLRHERRPHAQNELTHSEKMAIRRDRLKQVFGTLAFVGASIAFGLWALNFLLARIG